MSISDPNASPINPIQLYEWLCKHFNDDDLRTLCFYLRTPYDDLGAALGIQGKLRELVERFLRLERLEQLNDVAQRVYQARPSTALNDWAVSGQHAALSHSTGTQHNLPQPDYGNFIGREKELKQIHNLLLPYPDSRFHLILIDGVGGIGKSALALAVALHYLHTASTLPARETFDAIVWTSAKQTTLTSEGIQPRKYALRTLDDIHSILATVLQIEMPMDRTQLSTVLRVRLAQRRVLLVVDNLETVDDENVLSFLRELPAPTKAIVTTRHRIDVAYPVRLVGMSPEEAGRFITRECEKRGVTLSPADSQRVYQRTGGIPLALVWLIAQIGTGYSVETALTRLGEPTGDVARFCFEGVLNQIRHGAAYKLLLAIVYFDNSRTSRDLLGFATDLPEMDRDDGLVLLEKLSLVNKAGQYFTLLPLTFLYGRAELENNPVLNEVYVSKWRQSIEPYLASVRESDHFQVLGMPDPIALEAMYIDIRLRVHGELPLGAEYVTPSLPTTAPTAIRSKNGLTVVRENRRLLVMGSPGSGKTMFLRYIALQAAQGRLPFIPVLISLRNMRAADIPLLTFIKTVAMSQLSHPLLVDRILEQGQALLLLDGLDEIQERDGERDVVIDQINAFTQLYPDNHVAVTVRLAAGIPNLTGFTYAEIEGVQLEWVEQFVSKWFEGNQITTTQFLDALSEQAGLQELARSPLLLMLLCVIFGEARYFPKRRAEVYEEMLNTLLNKWDSSRGISREQVYLSLSRFRKLQLLSSLAFWSFSSDLFLMPGDALIRQIEEYFHQLSFLKGDEVDGYAVLKSLEAQHGIIVERARGLYSFAHLTLQEYLTASYITRADDAGLLALLEHDSELRWREVFLLVASLLNNATPFFERWLGKLEQIVANDAALLAILYWVEQRVEEGSEDPPTPTQRSSALYIGMLITELLTPSALPILQEGQEQASALARQFDAQTSILFLGETELGLHINHLATSASLGVGLILDLSLTHALRLLRHTSLSTETLSTLRTTLERAENTAQQLKLHELTSAISSLNSSTLSLSLESLITLSAAIENLLRTERGLPFIIPPTSFPALIAYLQSNQLLATCLELAYVSKRNSLEARLLRPPPL